MDRDPLVEALQAHLKASRRLRALRDTETLLAKLDAILDPDLRLHRFGKHLAAQSPSVAALTVAALRARVMAGEDRARRLCLGLLDRTRLSRVVDADHLEGIRRALVQTGEPSAGLLRRGPRRPRATEGETGTRPKEPVGQRISLARRTTRRLIERSLFDPDARVVRTILRNPRLTEADVLKLAAARRTTPEALEAIALEDRWITRYPVKVALANNPVTPPRVVLNLLPFLFRQDLEWLATASPSQDVREQAASVLAHRPGARVAHDPAAGSGGLATPGMHRGGWGDHPWKSI